jgi:Uri superfamily endonuclease
VRSDGGTYALVYACAAAASVDVGRQGSVALRSGYYVYIGSAFGPGGVNARVTRHLRSDKRLHWHIDYLSGALSPRSVWYLHAPSSDEHRWATALAATRGAVAVPRVGASDCRCDSHFFYLETEPNADLFERLGGDAIQHESAVDAPATAC